jgi:hypothetical protein
MALYLLPETREFTDFNHSNQSLCFFRKRRMQSLIGQLLLENYTKRVHLIYKGQNDDGAKKRVKRKIVKQRPIQGASLELIKKKRNMTAAQRLVEQKASIEKVKKLKKEKDLVVFVLLI